MNTRFTPTRTRPILGAAAAALLVAGLASAMPDEEYKALEEQINTKWRESSRNWPDDMARIVNETVTDAQVADMNADQLWEAAQALSVSERKSAAVGRLEELAKEDGRDGAAAALARVLYVDAEQMPAQAASAFEAAARHPGLRLLLQSDDGGMMSVFYSLRGEAAQEASPALLAFAGRLDEQTSPAVLSRSMTLFESLVDAGDEIAAEREQVRQRLVSLIKRAKVTAEEPMAGRLERPLTYLDGAFMKGELIGNPCPPLSIEWSSDPDIKSLDDLKGKVVVLDFWATWCGPCIRSFPNVAELVKRYEGHPVAVIGVTSVQGYHIGPDGRIDTKGDPAKEMELMKGFMEWRDMTWPVVFTSQPVFNPDFGVQGIPHVAILDTKGVVRYRGLHPGMNPEEKHEKIDKLLKEAGLDTP